MPIERSFAATIADLDRSLTSNDASSMHSFAVWLHTLLEVSCPFACAEFDLSAKADAPELARAGYALRLIPQSRTSANIDAWARCFERIIGRNLFPHDRQSFAFRPAQLIGIMLGAAECKLVVTPLQEVVTRLHSLPSGDDWQDLMNVLAARLVNQQYLWHYSVILEQFDLACLALATCAPDLPEPLACEFLAGEQERLCETLLERLLVETPDERDLARLATIRAGLAVACRRRLHLSFLRDAGGQYLLVPSVPLLRQIFENFGKLARALRQRHGQRQPFEIQDEYDVQDITSGLLKLHFDEVRRETWTPRYAGNASRVDFVLPQTKVVVEAKMTRASLTQRELVDQLIVDRERYANFAECQILFCFIYDPERHIEDRKAIRRDLENHPGSPPLHIVFSPPL